jgi:hypothetical protein
LILISGVGSAVGPLLGAAAMSAFGIRGLFNYMAVLAALFALFALARDFSVRPPLFKRPRPFLLLPAIFAHSFGHVSEERAPVRTGPGCGATNKSPEDPAGSAL